MALQPRRPPSTTNAVVVFECGGGDDDGDKFVFCVSFTLNLWTM
jgi:hypothetical protein